MHPCDVNLNKVCPENCSSIKRNDASVELSLEIDGVCDGFYVMLLFATDIESLI